MRIKGSSTCFVNSHFFPLREIMTFCSSVWDWGKVGGKHSCCNPSIYSFTFVKKSYPGCPNYEKVIVILSRTALEEDVSCLKYLTVICWETPSNWISVDANALLEFQMVNWYQRSLGLILETSGNGKEMQCCCIWPRDICFLWNKFLWKTLPFEVIWKEVGVDHPFK